MTATAAGTILVGYEVGTGEPVDIPLGHLAVTGQTSLSGKTTTLEALALRSGLTALAFVTKRGETAFADGHRVQPYFRDRADWQFVDQLLSAVLQEKNKFLRAWLIRICRTTKTLGDVQRAVRHELKDAKGINLGVYTQLDAYLDLIVPEIARMRLALGLYLEPGLNVMDVSNLSTPMQMLLVQSAIDWVNEHESNTVVIVPEAWEFIPEGKGSPVKQSAIALVRKGAGIGNYIWVDSQDMAGVDKVILRGCAVWLIGVQREANEIKRNLANIPKNITRPTAHAVATLDRGQFYVCWGKHAVKTYVQPTWLSEAEARSIALGAPLPPGPLRRAEPPKETTVNETEARQLREENEKLRGMVTSSAREIAELKRQITELQRGRGQAASSNDQAVWDAAPSGRPAKGDAGSTPVAAISAHAGNGIDEALYQAIKRRLISELPSDPAVLQIVVSRPELRVEVERHVIKVDGSSLRGRIARLIADDFFSVARQSSEVLEEILKRGADRPSNIELGNEMKALCDMGFFTRSNKWYTLVPSMRVNVVERAA